MAIDHQYYMKYKRKIKKHWEEYCCHYNFQFLLDGLSCRNIEMSEDALFE